MPSTAGDGEARVALELEVAAGCVGDGEDESGDPGVVEDAGALCAAGLVAIVPVDDAANTAAPNAMRPRIAMIGTSANRRSSGRRSRQLGQKPEIGVVTYPQFRHRTGRRVRATAWLAAFLVRARF